MEAGPLVRSSYHAERQVEGVRRVVSAAGPSTSSGRTDKALGSGTWRRWQVAGLRAHANNDGLALRVGGG